MTRVDLLEYALEGARTRRGLLCQFPDDEDEACDIERDIETIKRSIIRAKFKEQAKLHPAAAAWPIGGVKK